MAVRKRFMAAATPSAAPKIAEPATSTRGAGLDHRRRRLRVDAAVHLQFDVALRLVDHLPHPANLAERVGDELLAAEAGVDRHHQNQIDIGQNLGDGNGRGRGLSTTPAFLPSALMCCTVRCRLTAFSTWTSSAIGAGLGEGVEKADRLLDHQMDFQRQASSPAAAP